MGNTFDAGRVTEQCVAWIRAWFEENGRDCRAVVAISGGKDSSVTAALCVRALGRERVLGVLMPCGEQADIQFSLDLCQALAIDYHIVNIKAAVDGVLESMGAVGVDISEQTRINLPARIRMATVYAVSQSYNGRVANTCNLSEDWVGYATRYGDGAGDFAPLSNLTVTEVKAIGRELGLPAHLVDKPPIDGLCGLTDEEKLGFTYATLDAYIRDGVQPEPSIRARIDTLHRQNLFKLQLMPSFPYHPE